MEQIEPIEKKSFWKKKIIGIPVFMIVLMSIVLVVALSYIAYNQSFIKTINVFKDGGSSEYVTISGSGDIVSSVINCDATTSECSVDSGIITLTNSDTNPHDCIVTTTVNSKVTVSYDKEVNPITIPASSSNDFKITYKSNTAGSYPMTTTINCPA